MKKLQFSVFLTFFICCGGPVDSVDREQFGEFKVHDNGLVYDNATMAKLRAIVDSLNLRFTTYAPKQLRSLEQGFGTYISIFADSAEAKMVMTHAFTLAELRAAFPSARVLEDIWIAKEHTNHFGKNFIQYVSNSEPARVSVPDVDVNDKSAGWVFSYNYPILSGVYLRHLKATEIPTEYAKLIQYVDCMVDTTTTIFSTAPKRRLAALPNNASKVKKYLDLVSDFEPAPEEPKYIANEEWRLRWDEYVATMEAWYNHRLGALDRKMEDPANVKLLNDAVEEAITRQHEGNIDEYAARYLSPARALCLERSFRIFRTCGNDMRPTFHAKAICQLAVKANQWDIFLRAHLDVMNDSYFQYNESDPTTGRKSYVVELEQIGVNSVDLLLGICLRSRNENMNHYRGSTSIMARALAETAHQPRAVQLLLAMIVDERLDLFNRTAMAQTLVLCNRELTNSPAYQSNLKRTALAISTLPKTVQNSFIP